MAWGRAKTIRIFYLVLLLAVLSSAVNLSFIFINLFLHLSSNSTHNLPGSFLYLIGMFYVNAIGCLWFRLVKDKSTCTHGVIHTLVFGFMVFGHWDAFELIYDGQIAKCYSEYYLSLMCMIVYTIQYILSYHFLIWRWGSTPSAKAFRSGLHAFGGVLTFFLCFFDGFLICIKLSYFEHFEDPISLLFPFVPLTFMIVTACVWYMLLNPYFDWRRLSVLMRSRPSRTSVGPGVSRVGRKSSSNTRSKSRSKSPRKDAPCRPSNCPPCNC